ncbi:MAG TPA: polyamine aminopropyltransferase, partial [Candidatus Desulfofervidus auxilii]|nr:polyamine aminopropyltransferase [Candidatus Desulfofervidus auxilii]
MARQRPFLWFYEDADGLQLGLPVISVLYHNRSRYQDIYVFKAKSVGRVLVLDGCIQLTERDEFIYHELIIHPILFTHPCPKNVLVVGGGDGGSVREILKHESVKHIDLVEIDPEVIQVAQRYLPRLSKGLKDKRVKIHIDNGIKYVKNTNVKYDVVVIDSTDPVGMAKALYEKDFHQSLKQILNSDGLMVIQTQCPYYQEKSLKQLHRCLKKIYPIVRIYVYTMPTYPGALWSFTCGSLKYDPLTVDEKNIYTRWQKMKTRYYN